MTPTIKYTHIPCNQRNLNSKSNVENKRKKKSYLAIKLGMLIVPLEFNVEILSRLVLLNVGGGC